MNQAAMIVRKSLHDELVTLIRGMILAGELKPGEKIPEQALCERFGVSRTPLREALKVLASDGVIQLLQSRGAKVAEITRDEIEELFPIMGALEGLAGELACGRITLPALARIRAMHAEMMKHYEAGDYSPYYELNRSIHQAFFEAAGNAALTAQYNGLMVRIHSIRFVARKSPARWKEAIEDHERMMEALEARDGRLLGEILREHLRHKAGMVIEALDMLAQEAAR